jgi:hypothetical protein
LWLQFTGQGSDEIPILRKRRSSQPVTLCQVDAARGESTRFSSGLFRLAAELPTAANTVNVTDRAVVHRTKEGLDGLRGERRTKVTVYYTEEAGKKIAHFFEGSRGSLCTRMS